MELHNTIFTVLNGAALLGWSSILLLLLSFTFNVESLVSALPVHLPIILLYCLEGICLVEVGRIALGQLKGNLLLGCVLHAIRITCLVYILSDGLQLLLLPSLRPPSSSSHYFLEEDFEKRKSIVLHTLLILYSWTITEVCRYPMYLFPSSEMARKVRLVVPIVSFPVGCALEIQSAFRVARAELFGGGDSSGNDGSKDDIISATSWVKIVVLCMVILINGLLGPTLAYPSIVRKGLPVLMGRKSVMNKRPKRE